MSVLAFCIAALTASTASGDEIDLSPVLSEMVDGVIIPAYEKFVEVSEDEVIAIESLCAGPDEDTLKSARAGFATLVYGFSRIEAMRFGPAREENRFERLFFWPDRRSRGLRQVEGIIQEEDTSALDAGQLAEKSVAVQGLLALDFALSDDEAEEDLRRKGSFRCGYALAISRRIAATAKNLLADWSGPTGYGNQMKNAGPDQPVYRTSGEAMQEILRSASEMLTIDRDFKIARVIGEHAGEAKLKRAPFWRSSLWLRAIDGNIAFVEALFAGNTLAAKLDDENKTLPKELRFELEQARKAIADASEHVELGVATDGIGDKPHGLLKYATVPLHGAADILESRLSQALGLTIGFNSLDGD
ncbi:imelysin family protein [Hwanghaeella grinnelliae]|nr:imelysin family protein [Hwanghaeella grinnelliae]